MRPPIKTASTQRAAERRRRKKHRSAAPFRALLVTLAATVWAGAQSASDTLASPAAGPQIIERMVQQNEIRAEHLKYFTSRRHYHIDFHGLGRSMSADMHA